MYDLASGSDSIVASSPFSDEQPAISGDWVTWVENKYSTPQTNDLFLKNVVTGETRQITNDGSYLWQATPSISGSKLVWADTGNTQNNPGERLYDIDARVESMISPGDVGAPKIDGNIVVWPANTQVKMKDLSTGITQQVSNSTASYVNRPAVSAGHIIWEDERDGPRTIYQNRLGDTARTLANKYKPELKMARNDYFLPMPVEQFVNMPGTVLTTLDRNITNEKPTISDLASCAPAECSAVDLPGSAIDAMGGITSSHINEAYVINNYATPYITGIMYPYTVYARVVSRPAGNTDSFIQYWIFYYANNHPQLFHEGDWELIQIDLGNKLQPTRIANSQHGGGKWRRWEGPGGVEKTSSNPNRPVVYVGYGSHANYFYPGDHIVFDQNLVINDFQVVDTTNNDGNTLNDPDKPSPSGLNTSITVLPEVEHSSGTSFDWLRYEGLWGEFTGAFLGDSAGLYSICCERNGSQNPPMQAYWNNAFDWSNNTNNCEGCQDALSQGTETEGTAESPVDISFFDSQGRHTGKNPDGSIDQQIPNSEYLEYPELHRKSIIIHSNDINSGYRFVATGNGTGTADLIVTAPDHSINSVDTLNYNAIEVNPSTKISMSLDSGKNYDAAIDVYGDGMSVTQKAPDTTTTNSVDFTSPAQVSDLNAMGTAAGSAALTFTAPGDDGNTGTATSYDVRYSTSAITDQYWNNAIPASGMPTPLVAGSTENITISDLNPGTTYFFAVKAMDKAGLFSPISNVVSARIPITTTTTGAATAVSSSLDSIAVSAPYTGDENSDGAAFIQYKLSGDASWNEYGTVAHPATTATISGLTENAAYDVYVTYQDPDGVNGTAGQQISAVQLPAPPSASAVGPSGTIFGGTATVSANLSAGYGINPAAVSVTLDGNVISGCTVTTSALSCPVSGLTFGPHVIGGSVGDNAGNTAPITGSFNVGDNTAPAVADVLPTDTVYGGSAIVGADYSDPGIASGIDTASVVVYLDGNEINGCAANETNVSCETSGLASGTHTITGSVADNSGNVTPFSGSFLMIEWSQASVIYQSGLIPSQPSLYQLTDGRTLLVYTEQFTNALKFEVSSDGVNWQVPRGSTGTIPYAAGTQPSITQLSSGQIVVSYANYVYNPFLGHYVWNISITSSNDLINWSWPSGAWVSDSLAPTVTALDNNQMLLTYARQTAPNPGTVKTKIGTWNGSYFSWGLSETLVYGDSHYNSKPSVANLGNNEILCVFYQDTVYHDNNDILARNIYVVRSTDGGVTWQNQTPTPVYTGPGADFWPSLIKLSDGRGVCAFTTSDGGSVDQLNIEIVISSDRGYTWGNPQMISLAGYSESWPALAQRPDGSLIAVWNSDPSQVSNMYYLYSSRLIVP